MSRTANQLSNHTIVDTNKPIHRCNRCSLSCHPSVQSPPGTHYCSKCVHKLRKCEVCQVREDYRFLPFETRRIVVKEVVCESCRHDVPEWSNQYNEIQMELVRCEFTPDEVQEAIQRLRQEKEERKTKTPLTNNRPMVPPPPPLPLPGSDLDFHYHPFSSSSSSSSAATNTSSTGG